MRTGQLKEISTWKKKDSVTSDTSEKGLERLICKELTGGFPCDPGQEAVVSEQPPASSAGWVCGNPRDYDREYCLDLVQLSAFLHGTQPNAAESLDLGQDSPTRRRFLARVQGEVAKQGTIDILRKGINHGPHHIDLFYGTPSLGNEKAKLLYGQNRFSVTRQLQYSRDNTQLALDLCLFINGVPIATFELKNSLTKQTVDDAVEQYKRDRNPNETLFQMGRCLTHFAVDDHEVRFCTHLRGKASWFLPFNRGWDDGAGNPPNPDGLKTDYLWKQVLTRDSLTNIIENYAQIVETKDEKTGRKKRVQIWPRYHQLDVVRRLLADASDRGVGPKYLIQHSAGSGKSNSIAWLAHQLIGLQREGQIIFDSVIVVTDRRVLDKQIKGTIKQFAQVGSVVGHAESSGHLRMMLQEGKRIVITTVQKFPYILDAIGAEHRGRNFAIIIDEAHSSQSGKTSAAVSMALGQAGTGEEDETTEDRINRIMESKKLLTNASYFAFTATPKNKTLEIFGTPVPEGEKTRHVPFHSYTMKQAIQEGFIIDVLAHYTPVNSYYKLVKKVEGDPEFDTKRARKKLRRYVEDHEDAIRLKAEIMVDHFHDQVAGLQKIGGQARAMVVTSSIQRGNKLLLRHSGLSNGAQESLPGNRRLLRRARARRREGHRGVPERLLLQPDPRPDPGESPSFLGMRRQVSDRLRRAATAYDVRGQGTVRCKGGADIVPSQPCPSQEARRLRFGLRQRRGHHPGCLCRLLPDDHPRRGDGPQQAARPQGGLRQLSGLWTDAGGRVGGAVSSRSRPRPARPHPGFLRLRLQTAVGRGQRGGLQREGEGISPSLRLPVRHPALFLCGMGKTLHLPHLPDP